MKTARTARFSLVLLLTALGLAVLVGPAAAQTPPTGPQGTVLVFSDVHFDPFADPSLVATLAATPAQGWSAVLATAKQQAFSSYGRDANNALLLSALSAMAATTPRPDLILFPGDLLCHKFNATYARLTGDDTKAGLTAFILKTVTYFLAEVQKNFPGTPVYCALGNNDSTQGDYAISPSDPYLPLTAPVLAQAIPEGQARQDFLATYPRSGHYAVPLSKTGAKSLQLVVVNDIYWSQKYQDPTPGQAESAWLDAALTKAQASGSEDVWIMTHIPPGDNAFGSATLLRKRGAIAFKPLLAENANADFLRVLTLHAPVIKATFVGHTHRDAFRLVSADNTGARPLGLIRLIPAISPVTGNNPGFQVYSYDTASHALLDQTTFFLDLAAPSPGWAKEYTFSQAYGHGLDTPEAWRAVQNDLWTDPAKAKAFSNFYGVSVNAAEEIPAGTYPVYWLSIGHLTPDTFTSQSVPPQAQVQ